MIRIFKKEFNGFLNSLIAYMVIGVFLTAIGLLIWVFPETSVLDYGYAQLDQLFTMGPYVLIFLIPAITMKSFAEERKLGTLELLLTKPLSDWQIIFGKFLAAFALVVVALVPTLIYYFSVYRLGNPIGNIDTPGVIGSYVGLALLGGVFCTVGILSSSLTTNQIVAFIMAAFLCFILYSGFDALSTIAPAGTQVLVIKQLGILYHYESLSKGLVDSRDLIYFFSVAALMLLVTKTVLGSRQWQRGPMMKSREAGDLLLLANGLVVVVLVNMLVANVFFRLDLTDEKRYTIKEPTRQLLKQLDDHVYIEVFLAGDLNPSFKRFQNAVRETLEEFRVYSNNKVHYTFTDPAAAMGDNARNEFMADLASKGLQGTRVIDTKSGERSEKIVFPGAVVSYGGVETGVMLLKGNRLGQGSQQVLNQSIEGIEFELANEINKRVNLNRKRIGLVTGHGELDSLQIAGFNNALLEMYDVFKVDLSRRKTVTSYDALIIAKPTKSFSELDKYKLDQYVMQGGKILFLVDGMDAYMDSARRDDYYAFPYDLKLEDQLFKYGVRINRDLVQDRVSGKYPVVINENGQRPEMVPMEWPFYPLVLNYPNHPVTRNLDATETRFVSSIDTVKAEGVKKTPLLLTSPYSRKMGAPVRIDIKDLQQKPNPENFTEGPVPIAYLLEGTFTSLYKNRYAPAGADSAFLEKSKPTKILVIADGDVARNEVNGRTQQPLELGFDPVTSYTFANQNLLMNMVAYLTEENGLINARNKEVKIRPLDKEKVKSERSFWEITNMTLPLVALILFGIAKAFVRKRKYASF